MITILKSFLTTFCCTHCRFDRLRNHTGICPGSVVQVIHLFPTFLVVDVLGDLGPGSVVQVIHLFLTFLVVDVLGNLGPGSVV